MSYGGKGPDNKLCLAHEFEFESLACLVSVFRKLLLRTDVKNTDNSSLMFF